MSTDRRQQPRGTSFPSVYNGLSPAAAALLRASASAFDAAQRQQAERRRFERNLAAARAGLAANPTWSSSVFASGAL